jgi:acyl-CoA thioesterase-2
MDSPTFEALSIVRTSSNAFMGQCHAGAPGRAFGGQIAGQALLAAAGTVPPEHDSVHSLHANYLAAGTPGVAMEYAVTPLLTGRSFSVRRVRASQGQDLLAEITVSLNREGAEAANRQVLMPDVPAPYSLSDTPFPDSVSGRHFRRVVEQRRLEPEKSSPSQPPSELRWLRCRPVLSDDPLVHAAFLAYASDIRTASIPADGLYRHRQQLRVTTLSHSLWWHRPFRANGWLLYEQLAVSLTRGLGFVNARFFTRDGDLVASVAQQALTVIRP